MSVDLAQDAQDRYAAAEERRKQAQAYWEECGFPLLVTLPNGIETVAVELKVLVECETHADRLYRSLPSAVRRAGRPVGSQSAPDRDRPPKLVKLVPNTQKPAS